MELTGSMTTLGEQIPDSSTGHRTIVNTHNGQRWLETAPDGEDLNKVLNQAIKDDRAATANNKTTKQAREITAAQGSNVNPGASSSSAAYSAEELALGNQQSEADA